MMQTHQTAKTQYVSDGDVKYAYRRFGNTTKTQIPLMFLIHFRGTMDYWDPLLINSIAAQREVILFDNAGVGKSTGSVPSTIKGMALHAIRFLQALKLQQVDVLGFSMGGLEVPLVYLEAPAGLVRKLIIAGSSASAGDSIIEHPPEQRTEIGRLAGREEISYDDGFDKLFYVSSPTSQAAGRAAFKRIHERNVATSGEERSEIVSYGYADGGTGLKSMLTAFANFRDLAQRADGSYDRLGEIKAPCFIANGHDDFMLPTPNSVAMQQKIPNARLKLFPDSGHGFLFQYAEEFAEDVNRFLDLKD